MVRCLRKSKRAAFFFIVDAIIGILIFATTVFIIAGFNSIKPSNEAITQQLDLLSTDLYETELRNIDITADFFLDLKKTSTAYNPYLTVDEFVYSLILSGDLENAEYFVGNLTTWLVSSYGLNYSISNGTNTVPIYYRESSITTHKESRSSLAREKVTIIGSNITDYIPPVFSSVVIWR